MKVTQCERILRYMEQFGSITQGEAADQIGCQRLAARIADLKKAGHRIVSERVSRKNRFGETVNIAAYRLEE